MYSTYFFSRLPVHVLALSCLIHFNIFQSNCNLILHFENLIFKSIFTACIICKFIAHFMLPLPGSATMECGLKRHRGREENHHFCFHIPLYSATKLARKISYSFSKDRYSFLITYEKRSLLSCSTVLINSLLKQFLRFLKKSSLFIE